MNVECSAAESEESCFQVEFYFDDVDRTQLSDADLTQLRDAIVATLQSEGVRGAEVSVAVVSSARMQELNRQYLQHDYDTDVLSFCLETDEELSFLLGQLIVSLDYAQQQATSLSLLHGVTVPLVHELALYLVHGSLHLVGHDDHEAEERALMRTLERRILQPLEMSPVWAETDEDGASPLLLNPEPVPTISIEPQP